MSTIRVNKLRVGSFAKVSAVAQAVIAFVYGAVVTLLVVADQITKDSTWVKELGIDVAVLGLGVIVFPVVAYVVGWVQGAVAAVILNFVFRETQGLELEIENVR